MNLSELRKLRNNTANSQKILESIQEKSNKDSADDRFWKLTVGKDGNGSATIRFLPHVDPNEIHWSKYHTHSFQSATGKWFIENCPTTHGDPCPACESNKELWESGIEANKRIASARKRKLNYVFNIYVVKDPGNPDNEGKVFLYRAGKTIFDMIMAKRQPEDEDETSVDVFDLWEGANFKLKTHKEAGYQKYTKSTWTTQCPLADSDEEILLIMNKSHDVREITDKKNFKPYEQLKKRLDSVLSRDSKVGKVEDDNDGESWDDEEEEVKETPKTVTKVAKSKPAPKASPVADDDDDDISALLAGLADD